MNKLDLHLVLSLQSIKLGDTRALLREFFKQNFKVKCESSDTKDITW
jgi:hypothetical protein